MRCLALDSTTVLHELSLLERVDHVHSDMRACVPIYVIPTLSSTRLLLIPCGLSEGRVCLSPSPEPSPAPPSQRAFPDLDLHQVPTPIQP
jgi:hypothetical protein